MNHAWSMHILCSLPFAIFLTSHCQLMSLLVTCMDPAEQLTHTNYSSMRIHDTSVDGHVLLMNA